ncbi:MAG: YhgE/Pip domain-containing protein [Bacillota bacterium]|nr:YhgE/Pip domain-containing protein [Bacillota bacterium]
MRNIIAIFRGDLRIVRRNIIAWTIILGLVCVPSLYSWFNLAASWDPYDRTDQIKIALATDDRGYDGNLFPISVNLGDNLVASVAASKKYDWTITDSDDAVEGTGSGKYYAAVVVPESFSADIMSIFSENVHHSELIYYSNEKENAIAPKLIGKQVGEIQREVDAAVTESILELAINTAKNVAGSGDKKSASELMGNLNVSIEHVKNLISTVRGTVSSLRESAASMGSLLDTMGAFAKSLKTIVKEGKTISSDSQDKIADIINKADKAIADMDRIEQDLENSGLSDPFIDDLIKRIKQLKNDFIDIKKNLNSVKGSMDAVLKDLDKVSSELSRTSADAQKILQSLEKNLDSTLPLLDNAYTGMEGLQREVRAASETSDMSLLKNIFSQNTADLSAFLVSPVKIERIPVYHVQNNGAAVLPFYTSLSLWIGALIMVALMKTGLEEERRKELAGLKPSQEYLGRFIIFAAIGLAQTLIVTFGDLYYLGLECASPVKFLIASLFTSLVFVLFVYTLVVSFGNIGKAIAVVLLVMQVAGSGGILAIEMIPSFFRHIAPILPFTYSMSAMRESIGGSYGNTFLMSLAVLCLYIVFALLLGLLLRKPLIRLNRFFHEKLEDTKLI